MSANRLDELRELILRPDKDRLESIRQRVEMPAQRAADVAEVLPESIRESSAKDGRLIGALRGPLKTCISESVREDPDEYAAALFPVMGPAIRRSIAETLRAWTAQFSQVIEHSVSPRGLRWRFEAWRAGIPFGSYVIQKTMLYRVEDVYLIHSATGLLVAHVTQHVTQKKDEDAVSAMFSAIQSFVNDSFAREGNERLTTAELGDLMLCAEHGPNTTIVAVIRGVPPTELRACLETALERIENVNGPALATYNGERTAVRDVEQELQTCLLTALRDDARTPRPVAAFVFAGLLGVLALAWIGWELWMDRRANAVAAALADTPGLVVTGFEREGRTLLVSGLRDRFAPSASAVAATAGWHGDLDARLRPYIALDDEFVAARAQALLEPPDSATVSVRDGVLVVAGTADPQWIDTVRNNWRFVAGVDRLDDAGLSIAAAALMNIIRERLAPPPSVEVSLDGTRVVATGEAPVDWIESATQAQLPAPISGIDLDSVAVAERTAMRALQDAISQRRFRFLSGATMPTLEAQTAMAELAWELAEYAELAEQLGEGVMLTITGHSTAEGTDALNSRLEQERANAVADLLIGQGVSAKWLRTQGAIATGAARQNQSVATIELGVGDATLITN